MQMEASEGELRKRIRVGFNKVVDNVASALSTDEFVKALPNGVDAEEIRNVLVETFRENAQEVFREVSDSYELPEKLAAVEALLGPSIKGKRFPPPARQSPAEAMRIVQIQKKLAFKKILEDALGKAEVELAEKQSKVQESRRNAVKTLAGLEDLQKRFTLSTEDADTENEDNY